MTLVRSILSRFVSFEMYVISIDVIADCPCFFRGCGEGGLASDSDVKPDVSGPCALMV